MTDKIDLAGFDLQPAEATKPAEKRQSRKPGRIYTFYSFKGGVGRSMALANIAVLVAAQGKKVLIVDFDLEAPGLEHFFFKHDQGLSQRLKDKPGVIDLLGAEPIDWTSARTPVEIDFQPISATTLRQGDAQRSIDIIHSGRASRARKDYTEQVQRLNWTDLYKTHDIGTRFGRLRAEWIAAYDYIFIDSRTGVTDIGDLCTVVLPDHLVLLFVTNQQNIEGIASIYQRAVTEHRRLPFERSKLTVLPVLSRDEFYSENKLSREWRQRSADALSDLFHDWLPEDLRPIDAFQKIFIPYLAIWSFGEALPVLDEPDAAANPSSINAAYSRIARLILHDLDWTSLDEIADPAEIASTRAERLKELEAERAAHQASLAEERARLQKERTSVIRWRMLTNIGTVFAGALLAYFAYAYFTGADLPAEVARLEEQNTALQRERQTAQDDLARVQGELEEARAQLTTAASRVAGYETDLEKTRVELLNAREELETLRARLSTLEGQNRSLSGAEGAAGALREQLEEARTQFVDAVKNSEQCRFELQQSEDKFDDYMARIRLELTDAAASRTCQSDVQYLLRLLRQQ